MLIIYRDMWSHKFPGKNIQSTLESTSSAFDIVRQEYSENIFYTVIFKTKSQKLDFTYTNKPQALVKYYHPY